MTNEGVLLTRLFVTSYAPLALMLALRNSHDAWPPQSAVAFWCFAVLGVVGLFDAFRLPRGAQRRGHRRVELADVKDEGGQVAGYLATYLLPFLSIELQGWRSVAAFALYFLVLFVVFLRSDLALVNPALYIAGWRVASATTKGRRILILARRDEPVQAGPVRVSAFGRFYVQSNRRKAM